MSADPFDYVDDAPARPPVRPPVDHDDDEAAFWRGVRAEAGSDRPPHRGSYADYVAEVRRVAYRIPCRDCHVGVDEPCLNEDGQPLRRFPCHVHREIDARKVRQ